MQHIAPPAAVAAGWYTRPFVAGPQVARVVTPFQTVDAGQPRGSEEKGAEAPFLKRNGSTEPMEY